MPLADVQGGIALDRIQDLFYVAPSEMPSPDQWHYLNKGSYGVVYRVHFRGEDIGLKTFEGIGARSQLEESFREFSLIHDVCSEMQDCMGGRDAVLQYLREACVFPEHFTFLNVGGGKQFALLMPLMSNGSLSEYVLNTLDLSYQQLATILTDTAQCLAKLHRLGVVHRDVAAVCVL